MKTNLGLIVGLGLFVSALSVLREEALLRINRARLQPEKEFQVWAHEHNKDYINGQTEKYNIRFQTWKENLEFVYQYNSDDKSHWLGLNSLADLTFEEYSQLLGYDHESQKNFVSAFRSDDCKYCSIPIDDLPQSIDFRAKGVVTPIKNQGQCGSCWAFSAVASVETINALYGDSLVSLSEQEVLDCDKRDDACQGGIMDDAFEFVITNGGIDTLENYPYYAEDERCNTRKEKRDIVNIQSFQNVPKNNETALMQAAANQVVSVAIQANQRPFQMYHGGVFNAECGTTLDHGVNVVGYGVSDKGQAYWIVRNSWGEAWGDNGYILMARNIPASYGICGIAMEPSFPIKTKPDPPAPIPSPSPPPSPPSPPYPAPTPPAPSSPSSPPVQCDKIYYCPAGTTCCCLWEFMDMCLEWGCCPYVDAVCCSDHTHCCPQGTECDMENNSCSSSPSDMELGMTPWEVIEHQMKEKQPAFIHEA